MSMYQDLCITGAQMRLLKKFYKRKTIRLENVNANYKQLIDKKFINRVHTGTNLLDNLVFTDEYSITENGKDFFMYKQYENRRFIVPLIISNGIAVLALVIGLCSLLSELGILQLR